MLFQTRQGLTHPNTQMTQAPRPQVVQRQSTGELGRAGKAAGRCQWGLQALLWGQEWEGMGLEKVAVDMLLGQDGEESATVLDLCFPIHVCMW